MGDVDSVDLENLGELIIEVKIKPKKVEGEGEGEGKISNKLSDADFSIETVARKAEPNYKAGSLLEFFKKFKKIEGGSTKKRRRRKKGKKRKTASRK